MEDFSEKLQQGLSSVQKGVQKGFEDGKTKIQTSQEIMSLKGIVSENEARRSEIIFSLGEIYYQKIRESKETNEELDPLISELMELDSKIYSALKDIEEKTKAEKRQICECGNPLSEDDKFCKNCGKKVETLKEQDINLGMICNNCQAEIPESSKYCNSCGIQLSKE